MAVVTWKGLSIADRNKPGTWAYALARMIKVGGDYSEVLEDIGKSSVTKTTKKLLQNRVRPKTKDKTLLMRRTRRRKPSTKGITLVDSGVGLRQVAYSVGDNRVDVGVPNGYMAYHQEGRVPNAPRRRFLVMLTQGEIIKLINFHWKKAIK